MTVRTLLRAIVRVVRARRIPPVALPYYTVDELVRAGLYDVYPASRTLVPDRCPCRECQPEDNES